MSRLQRPLDPGASAAADEKLYAAHEDDTPPNALFDADGNRLPVDPSNASLAEEWRAYYRESLEEKSKKEKTEKPKNDKKDPPAKFSHKNVCDNTLPCQKDWIEITLLKHPGGKRPDWWPPFGDKYYKFEPYKAKITDGPKEGALDDNAWVRFDPIPSGNCSIHFYQFFEKIDAEVKSKGWQSAGTGQPTPKPRVHTALKLIAVTFQGNQPVENDTKGVFEPPEWTEEKQRPVCFVRKSAMGIIGKFKVTRAPSQTENVQIKAKGSFGSARLKWTGATVSVSPTDKEVTAPLMTGKPLPNQVNLFEKSQIIWHANADGSGWVGAGTSQNTTYVTLDQANDTPCYWTLLDVSCRGAKGAKTDEKLVAGFYPAFVAGKGTGKGIKRKRDGQELSYWLLGIDSPPVFFTADLLGTPPGPANGSGRCGSWAYFMADICKVHGVTSAEVFGVVPQEKDTKFFLVKNFEFKAPDLPDPPFRYKQGAACVKTNGAPGQGWDNPQPAFGDHGLVRFGGRIYDPSYGTGPFPDLEQWEAASLDGVGGSEYKTITMFGVRLRVPWYCARGFEKYYSRRDESLNGIAEKFGVVSGSALRDHEINIHLASKDPAEPLPVETRVYIPKALSKKVKIVTED